MRSAINLILLALLVLVFSGCGIDINRNDDGSLTVQATMLEADLQRELKAAIADPLIQDLTVDFEDGQINVTGERRRLKSDDIDTIRFQLNLGVDDGHLAVAISQALLNDIPIDEQRVALWNERIANRLARAGSRNPNSKLQVVTVGSDSVTMVWRRPSPC